MKIERLENRNADLGERLEEAEERVNELEQEVAMLDESDSTSRQFILKLQEEKAVLLEQIKQTTDPEKIKKLEEERVKMVNTIHTLQEKVSRLGDANAELQITKETQAELIGQLMNQLDIYKKRRANAATPPAKLHALKAAKSKQVSLL